MSEEEARKEIDKIIMDITSPCQENQIRLTEVIMGAIGKAFFAGMDFQKKLESTK